MKKIHFYFAVFFSISCFSQNQDFYQIGNGQTVMIDEWNECRSVVNSTGASIFVPTKTSAEWTSFRNNPPSGITLNACTFSCGSVLVDSRDGQSYNTVQIGTQCWMSENLNYGEMINGTSTPANNGVAEKWCLNNSNAHCESYGAYYGGREAMEYSTSEGVQGLCPSGWHIPSDAEWCALSTYLDPTVNCNTSNGFTGTDIGTKLKVGGSSGFNGRIDGSRNCSGSFTSSTWGPFKTSTYSTSTLIREWRLYDTSSPTKIYRNSSHHECWGTAIRCVKD